MDAVVCKACLGLLCFYGVIEGTIDSNPAELSVLVRVDELAQRVDVFVDNRPFFSYIWPDTLKKPVIFPLRTATGDIVTRGYPLAPLPGEPTDEPHQVGAWLSYGSVNGIDFWANSPALSADQAKTKGVIRHRRVLHTASGKHMGELAVESEWVMPDQHVVLDETTKFVIRGDAATRMLDRITTLRALDRTVVFNDTKEGFFAIRVARALEQPATKPQILIDAQGSPTSKPVIDNSGVTGSYRSSDGHTADEVWGTRARWVMLSGQLNRQPVTLAILDHPKNAGFPTYWHARGYGLFSLNPLGRKVFSNGAEELNYSLAKGASTTFHYRVLIAEKEIDAKEMNKLADAFAQDKY